MKLCKPKCRSGHPENYLCYLSKKYLQDESIPKTFYFIFNINIKHRCSRDVSRATEPYQTADGLLTVRVHYRVTLTGTAGAQPVKLC